ncbi:hypothetical protein K402DRAFT_432087 [Aulographum hederae CBS 113979]|uniref:Uncharacterized protein n=1 Tax=Aulographum hederae CBS 113979 TaxID=1176131 RepID=A0A6G1GYC1_9PEZI|nr:hypothetical protein K402DRAFT_432087 [Aulographum hederae CBS 113979]
MVFAGGLNWKLARQRTAGVDMAICLPLTPNSSRIKSWGFFSSIGRGKSLSVHWIDFRKWFLVTPYILIMYSGLAADQIFLPGFLSSSGFAPASLHDNIFFSWPYNLQMYHKHVSGDVCTRSNILKGSPLIYGPWQKRDASTDRFGAGAR